jgi:tetraacyldisaccharide 4'-kinase
MPELAGLRRWVEQGWYDSRPRLLLRPLSALYGWVVTVRRAAYRHRLLAAIHVGVPTVVIGNLTVGGAGKTSLVIWLAERLRQAGRRPGIVLRGYKGWQRVPRLVGADDDAARVGDEALLLARRTACPVAVGRRRAAAARLLADAGCDIIVADDGLQHLGMERDLDILVIDGERGFGNGALLPAGPLREPVSRLRAAGLVVVHGEDRHGVARPAGGVLAMHLAPTSLRHLATGREEPLHSLRGATVHAVAGIGNPQRFFDLLRKLGANPIGHPLPDHHRLAAADLAFGDGHRIVMTEKDAVRCPGLAGGRDDVLCLRVAAVLPQADAARLMDCVLAIGRK